jgi:uncharacterized protein VirK/YbjX
MRKFIFSFSRDVGVRIKDRLKLLLGAIIYPVQSLRWRRFARANFVLSELAARYPRVRHKIYRPYISRELSCADRVDILIDHYSQIFRAGLGDLIAEAAENPVLLAEFSGKNGGEFRLQLSAINVGHREGELTLMLMHQEKCIYVSSFALVTIDGAPSIVLGALQGLRSLDGGDVIRDVTRQLHGCRPKKLMVSMVRAIGDHLGCNRILLVSNKNRISVNWRRATRISSNYDETWEEMGAVKRMDGNFELPCREAAPDLALVASNKRAEARRRMALLGSVCASVQDTFEQRRVPFAYCYPERAPRVAAPCRP